MKKTIFLMLVFGALLGAGTVFAEPRLLDNYAEGEVLVMLESPSSITLSGGSFTAALDSSAKSIAESVGAKAVRTYGALAARSGKNIIHLRSDEKSTEQLLSELREIPEVIGVWPNHVSRASRTPNDPRFGSLWGLRYINASEAWKRNTGSADVFVAVIDTGIDYFHEDLAGNMGRDLDGNFGIDLVNESSDPMDDNGHGTHVAGIIGAVGDNGTGVVGVNWSVSLLGVKVLDAEASGYDSNIIAGLNYILEQKERGLNIRVANMSLTGWREPIENQAEHPFGVACRAVSDAEIVLVVAAGNEGQNLDLPERYFDWRRLRWVDLRGQRAYPACFTFENMITVASMAGDRAPSSFTNFSPNFVHIAAPGTDIPSTWPGNSYKTESGTSMAAPHVAGMAALIAAHSPETSASDIKARIVGNTIRNYHFKGRVLFGGYPNMAAVIDPPRPRVPVTDIEVSPDTINISGRASHAVTIMIHPANADYGEIIWWSDNPNVATVTPTDDGALITGLANGHATITAQTADVSHSASVSVTISGAGPAVTGGGGCSVGPAGATVLLLLPLILILHRRS